MSLETPSIAMFLRLNVELLAFVHTMLNRGLVAEGELASRMRTVRSRLESD